MLLVDASVPTSAVLIASVLGFAVIPFAGWLSDRFGRRITYRVFCLPYVRYEGWSVSEALDHHASREVTAEDWVELGRLFVEYFDEQEVRRE